MENTVLSVSDAIDLVNQTLDYAFPVLVIEGEVSSFKVNQGKFVFFDIKDETGTLGCFMMVYQLRIPLEDGMRVRVVATPKVTAWGKFSMTVREVAPVGEGSLKRAFDILKKKLEGEGLFAEERKRQLPTLPKYIAVISSTQAAGYSDFIRILGERWGGMKVEVAHVQVQGAGAADQIIRALKYFNEQEALPDLVAVIRGGGSADDLSVFNDEFLVRAVASSRVPVVVGVGHETDESLADLAADVRAATPSHAAQIIIPDKREIVSSVRSDILRIAQSVNVAIDEFFVQVTQMMSGAQVVIDGYLDKLGENLNDTKKVLSAYNPEKVLARGYAIVRGKVSVGSVVNIETAMKNITAEVKDVTEK